MHRLITLTLLWIVSTFLSINFDPQVVLARQAGETVYSNGVPAHYFVFDYQADGKVLPRFYRPVRLAEAIPSLSHAQMVQALNQTDRSALHLAVILQDTDGKVLFSNIVSFSPWLRGEFHSNNPEQGIDGHLIPLETSTFVVRVPQVEAARLTLLDSQLTKLADFDMAQLITTTSRMQVVTGSTTINQEVLSGSPSNRVDLVILGDGYTAVENDQFLTDAQAVTGEFFSISPLDEYSNYYNLYYVSTASAQSGADHPPYKESCSFGDLTCCGDITMLSDPLQGKMVNTAFDSRFCASNIHRLLVADYVKVFAAASAVPDWDQIILIVNDPTYGGSGGGKLATVSMHSLAVDIAQHEYGHSFAGLADEYTASYPGYPLCSDVPGLLGPCAPNVTDITDRAQIKWAPWILQDTPIPTPNDPFYDGLVGLFEGALYHTTGIYRSGYDCIMRALDRPFCQVPSQTYVLKLYQGGWGVPATGISLIEPGSTLPSSQTFSLNHPATQVFSADILGPGGGPSVEITWLDNGIPIPGETTSAYSFVTRADSPGWHEIKLHVKDVTALVNPLMDEGELDQSFSWFVKVVIPTTVSIDGDPSAIFADGVSTSTITATVMNGEQPLIGEIVSFDTSLGSISPDTGLTDQSGTVTTLLTAGITPGIATVTASIGSYSDSVEIEFLPPMPKIYLPVVLK